MTVAEWFEDHKDVGFTVDHPKTKAGHKTDIEMWCMETGKNCFRESITYHKISDERLIELLDDMYNELHR